MPNDHLKGTLSAGDYEKNKATILSWILSQPLDKVKDGDYVFSDSNYYLLGEIIGSVSQMPYETYMSEKIFKPALMNKTGFEADNATTRPYDSKPETAILLYEGIGYSALGVITNVSDLL
jgi:CubicO group peptidase (beta-lactamase class C family)